LEVRELRERFSERRRRRNTKKKIALVASAMSLDLSSVCGLKDVSEDRVAADENVNGKLGVGPSAVVGKVSTKRELFLAEPMRLDSSKSWMVWNNLGGAPMSAHSGQEIRVGVEDVVVVNGKEYTKKDCFLEALRLDPSSAPTWNNLAQMMSAHEVVQVNGKEYTKQACQREALRLY
jgi:hypothetical protein